MKNFSSPEIPAHPRCKSISDSLKRLILSGVVITLVFATTSLTSFAQNDGPLYVASVSTRSAGNGTVVSITADGSLGRAQTWQDREGFHVVVPEAVASSQIKSGRGIKLRKIGSSVEVLVQTKPGARVAIQVADNRLNVTVDTKLELREGESEELSDTEQAMREYRRALDTPLSYPTPENASPTYTPSQNSAVALPNSEGYPAGTASSASSQTGTAPAQGEIRQAGEYSNPVQGNAPEVTDEDEGFLSSVFSGTSALIVLLLGAFGFLAFRVSRSQFFLKLKSGSTQSVEELPPVDFEEGLDLNSEEVTSLVPTGRANGPSRERERKPTVVRPPVTVPASIFGAYRVDQEVGKLVTGQAHRMDVMSSRATEDRRAIEASLIKTVVAAHSTDEERRRARGALEEYGFVARQCAQLLLAPEAFDRTSAARSLGEVGSAAALPFLLEALYDFESIVRNQAVVSIGELKVPSAIGALLDMARKHPDVPSSLVSRALSACSLEGLDFFDTVGGTAGFLTASEDETPFLDITHLEPATSVEQLPQTFDDEALTQSLAAIDSTDIEERTQAIKNLAQFQVQDAVAALSLVARDDAESGLRALAIASLASINHESVFSAVLIGMADDSREVRAASARALSRLSFDRSDAYVRVIETSDEVTLRSVADACIKAGIVSQNIDRLSSNDRRHAYEAFCLICLLAKAGLYQPVLDAIKSHANVKVRMSAVHLLATTGQSEVLEQLRELANDDQVAEEVKTAIIEGMYKLEQSKPRVDAVEDFVVQEHEFESSTDQGIAGEFENSAGQGISNDYGTPVSQGLSNGFETLAGDDSNDEFENSAGQDMVAGFQFSSGLKSEIEVDEVEM